MVRVIIEPIGFALSTTDVCYYSIHDRKSPLPALYEKLADNLFLNHRELEHNVLVGELLVDKREGVELGLDVHLVLRVEVDLEELGAIETNAGALADDLRWEDEVLL